MEILTIVIGIIFVLLVTAAYGGYRAAIWVPMASGDAELAAKFADITAGDIVYDLGCGDGRFVEAAAAQGARAIGYEVSIVPYILAKIRQFRSPYKKTCEYILEIFGMLIWLMLM